MRTATLIALGLSMFTSAQAGYNRPFGRNLVRTSTDGTPGQPGLPTPLTPAVDPFPSGILTHHHHGNTMRPSSSTGNNANGMAGSPGSGSGSPSQPQGLSTLMNYLSGSQRQSSPQHSSQMLPHGSTQSLLQGSGSVQSMSQGTPPSLPQGGMQPGRHGSKHHSRPQGPSIQQLLQGSGPQGPSQLRPHMNMQQLLQGSMQSISQGSSQSHPHMHMHQQQQLSPSSMQQQLPGSSSPSSSRPFAGSVPSGNTPSSASNYKRQVEVISQPSPSSVPYNEPAVWKGQTNSGPQAAYIYSSYEKPNAGLFRRGLIV